MLQAKQLINHDDIKRQLESILSLPFALSKTQILSQLLGVLDLTTLEGSDTEERVKSLCLQARSYSKYGFSNVAAVCVYPVFASIVKNELIGSDIKTACVAGAFPSGQSFLDLRLQEVRRAVDNGADEIDMVISRGRFMQGDFNYVFDEIALHKEASGKAHLKVILETGELHDLGNIYYASQLAIAAGADFIKTSTGKITPAATEEAFYVMLLAIKNHFEKTGKKIGIKPAGGISEPESAIRYFHILYQTLGHDWTDKALFRIGASRLASKIADYLLH